MSAVVGILHPGEMGAGIAEQLVGRGCDVLWASTGRSAESRARAEAAGLTDVGTLAAIVQRADFVLSICPPDAALEMATEVAWNGFAGCYVDANAISWDTAEAVRTVIEEAGADFVDGCIIGPPPADVDSTRLYLASGRAAEVAALFKGSLCAAVVLDGPVGAPSALKACNAGWTKVTRGLVLALRAAARAYGVEDALLAEWAISQPDLVGQSELAVSAGRKAWRQIGEMEEHAATFERVGVTGGFHRATADVCSRLASWKDLDTPLVLQDLLDAIPHDPAPATEQRTAP